MPSMKPLLPFLCRLVIHKERIPSRIITHPQGNRRPFPFHGLSLTIQHHLVIANANVHLGLFPLQLSLILLDPGTHLFKLPRLQPL